MDQETKREIILDNYKNTFKKEQTRNLLYIR